MLLGFSTGCLYKTHDRLSPVTFDIFRKMGCNAIELMWHESMGDGDSILKIEKSDLVGFKYISLHAPSFDVLTEVEIVRLLGIIQKAHEKLHFDTIVIHPYETINWEIFRQFDLPFAVENMDWRKNFGKYTESLNDIFLKFDVPMVMDVNHCYSNDPSMQLAYDMSKEFKGRIGEIHLSGFEHFHEPLFQTRQIEILKAVPDKNLPIIIESGCETVEDAKKELEYIKSFFGEKKAVSRKLIF